MVSGSVQVIIDVSLWLPREIDGTSDVTTIIARNVGFL